MLDIALDLCLVILPYQPIHTRRCVLLKFVERLFEQFAAADFSPAPASLSVRSVRSARNILDEK
jgi:hypothetical protein